VVRGLHIFDVAVGYAASEKKNNYKNIEKKFTFDVLTPHSFQSVLLERKVFTQQECTQLLQNYSVFKTEYEYWMACLKLQKILRNDQPNFADPGWDGSLLLPEVKEAEEDAFVTTKIAWVNGIRSYIASVNNTEGL